MCSSLARAWKCGGFLYAYFWCIICPLLDKGRENMFSSLCVYARNYMVLTIFNNNILLFPPLCSFCALFGKEKGVKTSWE